MFHMELSNLSIISRDNVSLVFLVTWLKQKQTIPQITINRLSTIPKWAVYDYFNHITSFQSFHSVHLHLRMRFGMPGPEQLPGVCHSLGAFRTENGDGMLVSEYLPGCRGHPHINWSAELG